MTFVGTTRAQLEAWRAGDEAGTHGFAATPAMVAAHGYGPPEAEDADFAAQQYAGVASLRLGTRRWVAAVEADPVEVDAGSAYGLVEVPAVRWRDVRALFTDEPASFEAVAALAGAVAGRTVVQVLTDAAVLDAADEHDLLWYSPEELDRIE